MKIEEVRQHYLSNNTVDELKGFRLRVYKDPHGAGIKVTVMYSPNTFKDEDLGTTLYCNDGNIYSCNGKRKKIGEHNLINH